MASFSVEHIVDYCVRHARLVTAALVLLGVLSGIYATTHFQIDTNSEKLISADVPWRQRQAAFDQAFPQRNNLILIVIDGVTPERAEDAAAKLAAALAEKKTLFPIVRRPDGGPFFTQNGLLFMSPAEVQTTTKQLIQAQPFLSPPAADPSLRGVLMSLSTVLLGVNQGQSKLSDIERPIAAFADVLGKVAMGEPAYLSWRTLMTGGPAAKRELRRFVEVQAVLDYTALSPGTATTDAIRNTARQLGLTPDQGVRVRLTGAIPLQDEEFASLADRALLMMVLMMAAVLLVLWLAVRSFKLIGAILLSLFVGLAMTTGFGLAAVGGFNVISVAFIALFVGLGVDFGIQFCVRYRAERHKYSDLDRALHGAGRIAGKGLTLAALATCVGFLSFLPTNYSGVAQLGLIAGFGMAITYVLSITLLPALIKIFDPGSEAEEVGFRALAPVDKFLHQRCRLVMGIAAVLGLIGVALIPLAAFDFNPLNMRNPKTESVSTLLDLMADPDTSPNTIDILTHSRQEADALATKISSLPEVEHVVTLDSFVPGQQDEKLAAIADAAQLLDSTINPFVVAPAPNDMEIVTSLKDTAAALNNAAMTDTSSPQAMADAKRLADILARLAAAPPELRARAAAAIVPAFNTMLGQMRDSLQAKRITRQNLPEELVREWEAPSGLVRIQVYPKGNANDNAVLRQFSDAVLKVAPTAIGTPIATQESGRTVVEAFVRAGILSFFSIMVLLAIILRRAHDVMLTVIPLLLAGIMTMATCTAIGLEINFANIIALPLLFGIGVAFDIYFVVAWRNGARWLLQSALTRAILYSAATTASAFGTLWLSTHPGTASMGELLTISLVWILLSVLFFLPALLSYDLQRQTAREHEKRTSHT